MIEITSERKIDVTKVEKGDFISLEVLREATGLDPFENVDLYRLALLRLRGQIEDKRGFTTRGEGFSLRVLTDAEAIYHNEKTREHGIKKMERAYVRATAIDENNLDELTAQKHRRTLEDHSRILGSARTAIKQIRSERAVQGVPRNHAQQSIKIISTKGDFLLNGTETNESNAEGHRAIDPAQWPDGRPAEPTGKTDEAIDREAQ